jgi:hypothetical protein
MDEKQGVAVQHSMLVTNHHFEVSGAIAFFKDASHMGDRSVGSRLGEPHEVERKSRLREQIRKDALGIILQDRWHIFVEKFLLGY